MDHFKLVSPYQATGDQPQAIEQLAQGILRGIKPKTLFGGDGQRKDLHHGERDRKGQPAHPGAGAQQNPGCAAVHRVPGVFPENAVEYFVSYYDYYQPEAYIPPRIPILKKTAPSTTRSTGCAIRATAALSERRDVIIVASVSCIYSLGDPIDYRSMVISLRPGMQMDRDELCRRLVETAVRRNDINFVRNKFRVRGDVVEIYPCL